MGFAVALVALALGAHGLSDFKGRPLGTDFSNIYVAGRYALEGEPTAPFDPPRQEAMERTLFGPATPFYGWHYPPFFLLVAAPLAHLSYLPALAVWQAVTFALYLAAMALLMRAGPAPPAPRLRDWLLIAIAFPAVFVNLTHGHNGFLTAALMAAALALLDLRPVLAGLCFGLLVYKPQFGLMIPLVLAATARWRVFASATATVAALVGIVTLLFGPEVWTAFLASTHFTRTVVLEQGGTGFYKIQSAFALVRLWGGPVVLAYVAQAAVTIAVGAFLVQAVAQRGELRAQGGRPLSRRHPGDALQPRLRHDGAGAGHRAARRRRAGERISTLVEGGARRPVARAGDHAQRRRRDADPARRADDAGRLRARGHGPRKDASRPHPGRAARAALRRAPREPRGLIPASPFSIAFRIRCFPLFREILSPPGIAGVKCAHE